MDPSGSDEETKIPQFPPKLDFKALQLKMQRKTPISFLVPAKGNNARRTNFGTGAGRALFCQKEPTEHTSQASARFQPARRLTTIPNKGAVQTNYQRTFKVPSSSATNDLLKRKTIAVPRPLRKSNVNNVVKNRDTVAMRPKNSGKENRAPKDDMETSLLPLDDVEDELHGEPSVFQPRKMLQNSTRTSHSCCCLKDLLAGIKLLDDKVTERLDEVTERLDKLQQTVDRLEKNSAGVGFSKPSDSEPAAAVSGAARRQTDVAVLSTRRRSARLQEKSSDVYCTLKKNTNILVTPARKSAAAVTPTPVRYTNKVKSQLSQLFSD